MRYKTFLRIGLAVVAVIGLLGVVRFKPWQGLGTGAPASGPRQDLAVGFLPVT